MRKMSRSIFRHFNVDSSSSSSDPLGSRTPAQVGVKDSYPPLKSGYFTAIISCSVNTFTSDISAQFTPKMCVATKNHRKIY